MNGSSERATPSTEPPVEFTGDDSDDRGLPRATTRNAWDGHDVHLHLARLTIQRARFRILRTLNRLRSPRRILATSLALLFFSLYLLNGIFILSARQPADPERLRLWLSGGMVLYAVYHCLRCAWSENITDLELTPAEKLWLGGAPIQRSSLAVYHVGNMMVPAILKTLLLSVVLSRDVNHLELLLVGVLTSLLLLEISRLMVARWAAGLDARARGRFRLATTVVASAVAIQVISHLLARTPMGSSTWMYVLNLFQGLGATASCATVQWMSAPWIASANLSVTSQYGWLTLIQLASSACILPLSILALVRVDAWSVHRDRASESARLATRQYVTRQAQRLEPPLRSGARMESFMNRFTPYLAADATAVALRQWVSVCRYYRTIMLSFLVPTLLCLSPLLTGQAIQQWFFVVGGIAMCTMLLAPPALRIDFRRDLRRMLLLRSLPIKPFSMVLGQLAFPIAITWTYQWITIAIAAIVTRPDLSQLLLWTGMLNALAVFTFAAENALFLAYPHFERVEGVAMMIRAKLTFLGKGSVIAASIALLFVWTTLCRKMLPEPTIVPSIVAGALLATWGLAAASLMTATYCWRRFELTYDTPPE